MKTPQLTQKMNLRETGSFFNWIYANNGTLPVAGEWATILSYTDRDVCKIIAVSPNYKRVVIEDYNTEASELGRKQGMGHQDWVHKPTGRYQTLVYRHGAWRVETTEIQFTKEFKAKAEAEGNEWRIWKSLTKEQYDEIYGGEVWPQKEVAGITKKKDVYSKIRIVFGVCDYHYDWTF